MDELRWFLLIIGLVVIAAVLIYSCWQDWRQDGLPWRRQRRAKREPFADDGLDNDLRGDLEELDTLITEQRTDVPPEGDDMADGVVGPSRPVAEPVPEREPPSAPEPDPDPLPPESPGGGQPEPPPEPAAAEGGGRAADDEGSADTRAARRSVSVAFQSRMRQALGGEGEEPAPRRDDDQPRAQPAAPPDGEDKLVVLTVMAPEDAVFAGEALVAVLAECGLQYGEHRIYHRTLETQQGLVSLYSVANVVEPGCLDREHMADYTTPGVALFMQLPGPFDGVAAFEQMLQTARTLAERLGGQLLDGRRCNLTQQSIEHIREELVEYRRRARLAARRAR